MDLGIGQLFDDIADAVIVARAVDGQIVLWNPAAMRTFGYSET
ncbi:MAG: PAS domain-containing protein, partial [Chloroflexota bacterium]